MTSVEVADVTAAPDPVEATSDWSGASAKRLLWEGASKASRAVARPTDRLRVLPDTLLIGTQRGGTTSLYRTLRQHEGVRFPRLTKGVHWWDRHPDRSIGWYRSHFPMRAVVERDTHRLGYRPVVAEASPYYLFHPTAPARIAEDCPGVRVIAVLREPVSRTWSHYHHEVARGFETRSFRDAIAEEDAVMERETARLLADPTATSYAHRHHAYRWRGRYAEQLERWFDAIGRDRVLVLFSDDFRRDALGVARQACDFLQLPPLDAIEEQTANQRSNPKMPADVREELLAEFAPWDARLTALLADQLDGGPLPWARG